MNAVHFWFLGCPSTAASVSWLYFFCHPCRRILFECEKWHSFSSGIPHTEIIVECYVWELLYHWFLGAHIGGFVSYHSPFSRELSPSFELRYFFCLQESATTAPSYRCKHCCTATVQQCFTMKVDLTHSTTFFFPFLWSVPGVSVLKMNIKHCVLSFLCVQSVRQMWLNRLRRKNRCYRFSLAHGLLI